MSAANLLEDVVEAELTLLKIEDEFLDESEDAALTAIDQALQRTMNGSGDAEEFEIRLRVYARILGEFEGPRATRLLVQILGSGAVEAKQEAGEALQALAESRFKEVAQAIEECLSATSKPDAKFREAALCELPYVVSSVNDPQATKLLTKFLKHSNANVVAAAIEVLAELGDPACRGALAALTKDARNVELEDQSGSTDWVSLGDLAEEAISMLRKN